MKPALLIAFLGFFAALPAEAQKIRFTDTSNKWKLLDVGNDGPLIFGNPLSPDARFQKDTVIAGVSYHLLSSISQFDGGYAVREDTAAGRLYFRFMQARVGPYITDTGERVFFDYSMRMYDTLRIRYDATHGIAHYVSAFDSLYVGAHVYKKWKMTPLPGNTQSSEYTFVEGIGCLGGPGWPVFNLVFEHRGQLRCFTNKGTQPVCFPAPLLPWWSLKVKQGYLAADSFNNTTSCTYKLAPNAVEEINAKVPIIVAPSPGGPEISLILSANIPAGILQITNAVGQILKRVTIKSGKTNIGQYLSAPGVYYYTLQEAATGQRYNGRFIFR